MSISKDPNSRPRKQNVRRWDYLPIPNGTSATGWLAGQPVWVDVHHVGESKPCVRSITKSALVCPYCESGLKQEERGYTPFYDADYNRKFVLIPEESREQCSEINHLSQIRIVRPKGSRAGLVVRAEMWRTRPLPDDSERAFKVDLTAFLLHVLWKNQPLIEWYAAETHRRSAESAKSLEIPKLSDDPALGNLRNRIKQGKSDPAELADVLGKIVPRAEAEKNGKGKRH